MSRVNHNIPVLGSSRSAPYTHADFSKDLQVYHQNNQHHPNQLYNQISKNFIHSIELQQNPSEDYSSKMKNLYMEELDHSLNQYKNKQSRQLSEAEQFKRGYKQNINTLVLYIERENNRRKQVMMEQLKKIQQRQKWFIDGDRIRNKKIEDHISKNQYNNSLVFAKSQLVNQEEDYRKNKQEVSRRMQKIVSSQTPCFRLEKGFSVQLERQRLTKSIQPTENTEYNSKCQFPQIQESQPIYKLFRVHNPITYPIEYHIDNPYFINKMQKKYHQTNA